jgi:CDP-glucose 4,6-dehydratase
MVRPNSEFWAGKRVFVTGHTGFKGGWLTLWLSRLGAHVTGYSLDPTTRPSFFEATAIGDTMDHNIGDIRDYRGLHDAVSRSRPEIVFHLAAQPIVRRSYDDPVETYSVNVVGTATVLEALRRVGCARAIVNITSDKCYENREWVWGYREHEPMGGYDPYSSSKGCAELVTSAFRNSFFNPARHAEHGVALASARAGNVIGGGDWAEDRLIPDAVRAFTKGERLGIRFPEAIRPWQHVLEPLAGYLILAERLWSDGASVAEGWNFGPGPGDEWPVRRVVEEAVQRWGDGARWKHERSQNAHEAHYLKVDSAKARTRLGWHSRWDTTRALSATVAWYKAYYSKGDMREFSLRQIEDYARD